MSKTTSHLPDLSAFDVATPANAGYTLELLDKNKRKTGHTITVLGRDSDSYQSLMQQQNRRRWSRMQKANSARMTQEELEEDALDLLAACVKAWSFTLPGGDPFPCNASNAVELFRTAPYIKEQVDEAVADRGNFTQD